ncbi:MAG: NAD(P)H-dependent oxidoreductase, partial [Rickettsiales bacterium]
PEFNWSVPGNIKNAIDWISRVRPVPIAGKSVFLAAASPSMTGGVRGLLHFRVSLESLGVWTYPKVFALAQAAQAFDDDGGLANAEIAGMLKAMLEDYCSGAQALNNR